jgi:hypothetical protein
MYFGTEHKLQARLASHPDWASTSLGRLTQWIVDYNIPLRVVAEYLGVNIVVFSRWIYGQYKPGGRLRRRREMNERIDKLLTDLPRLRSLGKLQPPWLPVFPKHSEMSE